MTTCHGDVVYGKGFLRIGVHRVYIREGGLVENPSHYSLFLTLVLKLRGNDLLSLCGEGGEVIHFLPKLGMNKGHAKEKTIFVDSLLGLLLGN